MTSLEDALHHASNLQKEVENLVFRMKDIHDALVGGEPTNSSCSAVPPSAPGKLGLLDTTQHDTMALLMLCHDYARKIFIAVHGDDPNGTSVGALGPAANGRTGQLYG